MSRPATHLVSRIYVSQGVSHVTQRAPPPLSPSLLLPFLIALRFFFSLFPSLCAPLVPGCLCFPAPGALGLGAALCLLCSALRALCFFCPPPLVSSSALACFVSPGWPVVVPRWLLPPPPPFCVSRFPSFPLGALGFFFIPIFLCAPVVSGFLWFPAPGALGLGAVFCLVFSGFRCPALRVLSLLSAGCCPPPPLPLLCLVSIRRSDDPSVARWQQKKKKQEKDAQPGKIKRKILFSDLRKPPENFTPLFGEVAKFRTLTNKEEQ